MSRYKEPMVQRIVNRIQDKAKNDLITILKIRGYNIYNHSPATLICAKGYDKFLVIGISPQGTYRFSHEDLTLDSLIKKLNLFI